MKSLLIVLINLFVAHCLQIVSMSTVAHQRNEINKLARSQYFDQARIDQIPSLRGFNLQLNQIVTTKKSIKCYVLSDIHADSEKNQVWVRERCLRSPEDVANDVFTIFIVPGDIGSEIDRIESVLRNLVSNYDAVCYLPGNHEAWRKGTRAGGSALLVGDPGYQRPDNRMAVDSVAKLVEVMDCARALGVHVGPLRVQLAGTAGVQDGGALGTGTVFGVNTAASTAGSAVLVLPLYGWYHSSWDTDPDITDPQFLAVERSVPFSRKWGDYAMCAWPGEIVSHANFIANPAHNTALAEAFAKLNEPFLHPPPRLHEGCFDPASADPRNYLGSPLASPQDTIISYSHYLPRLELCPEKRFLTEPMLAKVVGSDVLESQVRRLQPALHLYGHTHIPLGELTGGRCLNGNTDMELEGVRYLQWPLGYFREAQLQCAPIHSTGPLLVHDSALGPGKEGIPRGLASEHTAWSRHYRTEARDQSRVNELAPWVRARLAAYAGMG